MQELEKLGNEKFHALVSVYVKQQWVLIVY